MKTCILTGATGENPDDCTTHGHEPLTPDFGHELSYTEEVVMDFKAVATPAGNLLATDSGEVLSTEGANVYCAICGPLGSDELADHGLSEYWEQV